MTSDHATTALCELLERRHAADRRSIMRTVAAILLIGAAIPWGAFLSSDEGVVHLLDALLAGSLCATFLMLAVMLVRLTWEGLVTQDAGVLWTLTVVTSLLLLLLVSRSAALPALAHEPLGSHGFAPRVGFVRR